MLDLVLNTWLHFMDSDSQMIQEIDCTISAPSTTQKQPQWMCRCKTLAKIKEKTLNYVLQLKELRQTYSEDDIFWIWTRENRHSKWSVINHRIEKMTNGMGISLDQFRVLFAVLHCCQRYSEIRGRQATHAQFTAIVNRNLLQPGFTALQVDSKTLEATLAVCMNAYNKYFS